MLSRANAYHYLLRFSSYLAKCFCSKVYMFLIFTVDPVRLLTLATGSLDGFGTSAKILQRNGV